MTPPKSNSEELDLAKTLDNLINVNQVLLGDICLLRDRLYSVQHAYEDFLHKGKPYLLQISNKKLKELLSKPIDHLELSIRSSNRLSEMGIEKIYDLVVLQEQDLIMQEGLGKKTFLEVKSLLKEHGLSLGMKDFIDERTF